jgi:hypothetical protein
LARRVSLITRRSSPAVPRLSCASASASATAVSKSVVKRSRLRAGRQFDVVMDKYALVLTSEANSYSTARQFRLSDAIGRPHCARYTYCYAGSRIIRIAKAVFTSRPITYIPSANQSRFIAARITPTAANTSMPRKIFIMATTRTPCHARNRTSGEEIAERFALRLARAARHIS